MRGIFKIGLGFGLGIRVNGLTTYRHRGDSFVGCERKEDEGAGGKSSEPGGTAKKTWKAKGSAPRKLIPWNKS